MYIYNISIYIYYANLIVSAQQYCAVVADGADKLINIYTYTYIHTHTDTHI